MGIDRARKPRIIQLGNQEQVIVVKVIRARGFTIPPLIIFKAVIYQTLQYENRLIPLDWAISVSENSQTTNEIGLWWLKHVFNKHIRDCTIGRYRLLILNSHGSYVSPKFDQYCLKYLIIILCMPAHLLYLLQPLNVGYFLVLK